MGAALAAVLVLAALAALGWCVWLTRALHRLEHVAAEEADRVRELEVQLARSPIPRQRAS
jgi:hypothetical protein